MASRINPRRAHPSLTGPRVAVLVDTATSWGRRIHTGIHHHIRKHEPWQVFVEARGLEDPLRTPPGWRGDGIIARVGTSAMARELKALRIPVVNVSGIQVPEATFPRVMTDLQASARLAAAHFYDRGFRHLAYFSLLGLSYVAAHQDAFIAEARKLGCDCAVHAVKPRIGAEPDWNLDLARLGDWLQSLPHPVGILTWNPSSSREIIFACQVCGLLVPEDVAVLSGSDDDLLCDLLHVPVSGILVAAEQIGQRAAELLHLLMRGEPAAKEPILIPPAGVVIRQSTDTLAIQDRALVKALGFIRQACAQPMQVNDVARAAGVSRRVLERRFAQQLGRTPAAEIRRVRLERAKQLLLQTDLPIPEVAEVAGFGSTEYLAYVFRSELRLSPSRYRREHRSR